LENKYLIFLGCAVPYRVASYEISSRKILQKLGIKLIEMPEFNCCGLPLDMISHESMLTLSARNLVIAEQAGLNIITLCPGCAGTLKKVNKVLKENRTLKDKINNNLKETGLNFKASVETKHITQFLIEDVGVKKIEETIINPLSSLKVAEHIGCHLLRPKHFIDFDDPEDPKVLKTLIEATGAECLDYMNETECCGAPSVGVNDKVALKLAHDKFKNVKIAGAQALITSCPFCHIMFDTNELRIERVFSEKYGIPVLHYPQLLGLAMGITPEELGFKDLRVDASKILTQVIQGVK